MCGRYALFAKEQEIAKRFGVMIEPGILKARFNAAPSQVLPVILSDEPNTVMWMKWGMVPVWWSQKSRSLINITAENLQEKKTFRSLLARQRCLVLANGFYEWKQVNGAKQPYFISLLQEELYAFAGLWSKPTVQEAESAFAIITTAPNELVSTIHDRMPCILSPEDEKRWLNVAEPTSEVLKLLRPFPAAEMKAVPVSRRINVPVNDDPSLIEAIKPTP